MMRAIFAMALFTAPALCSAPHAPAPPTPLGSAKMLFCDFGGVGFHSRTYDPEFAVALIQIDSPIRVSAAAVSDFQMIGRDGVARLKSVLSVDVSSKSYAPGQPYVNYDSGPTDPWNGTFPAGTIRLRVRVEFAEDAQEWNPSKCRATVGPYDVEGRVFGRWPT